jgi:hypothetical protein
MRVAYAGTCRQPGSPIAEIDRPGVDDRLVADDVHSFVVGDGGVYMARDHPDGVAYLG